MPKALLGYFGANNFGDEWTLAAFLLGCRQLGYPLTEFFALSRNPKGTMQEHGVLAIPRRWRSIVNALRECAAVLGCGGSLLQDVTSVRSLAFYSLLVWSAKGMGKKVLLVGQGLGPLQRVVSQRLARITLNLCDLVTFRDPFSLTLAQQVGARLDKAFVTADLTFIWDRLPPHQPQFRVAVNLRPVKGPIDYRTIADALRHFAALGDGRILLLPLQVGVDETTLKPLAGYFQRAGKRTCPYLSADWWHSDRWANALEGIGKTHLIVAMRLHALIAACLLGVPFVGLSYDPKVASVLQQALPDQVLPLKVTAQDLLAAMTRTEAQWQGSLLDRVQTFLEVQRKAAWRNFELLAPLLAS